MTHVKQNMTQLRFTLDSILKRLNSLKGLENNTSIAKVLHMNRTALAERKRRGSIPYAELVSFCDINSISLIWLFYGKGPVYMGTATYEAGSGGSKPLDMALMKDIIESVEEVFEREALYLPASKKAELIMLLYDEVIEDQTKKTALKGRVIRLVKLAS